ncbi:unnamed protein product [Phytophthora lilii]|uniref:Unnamed protein product n=1 Tax=Phytophthora lilii TaxID=2077276 RepID=A0A9W6WWY1_9STRA|nr:unnamed protein product [Phytophthora lilii]
MTLRAAAELYNTTGVSEACTYRVGFGGLVSTDTSSLYAMLPACRDYVTPYKLAIAPDNDITRKYFFETVKQRYPRVTVSDSMKAVLSSLEDSVIFFDTEKVMEKYVKKIGYGKSFDTPIVYGALVFDEYPEGVFGVVFDARWTPFFPPEPCSL